MMKIKNILIVVFFTALVFSVLGCSSDSEIEESLKETLVKVIAINGNNITDGSKEQLTAIIVPTNASNRSVLWSVSDESIAVISNTGLLTAVGNGEVKVTVTATDGSGVSADKIFTVSGVNVPPVLVQEIILAGSDITDGQSQQISVQVLPEDAENKEVVWSVSNEALAEINTDGLLIPKDNGEITITATAKDGSRIFGKLVVNITGVTSVYVTILKAENMLLWQRNNGGWPKEPHNDFSGYNREQTNSEITRANNTKNNTDTTIDNEHTVGELRYLLSAYKSSNNPNYLDAVLKAIDYLLEAQYDNGGWPQYYPDTSGYRHQITFNDNAMVNVMNLMWDISKSRNNTDIIDPIYVNKAITAFNNGIDVILQTQTIVNGKKAAWCAQYDEVSLLPATARSYELPSNSGSESVGIIRTLMLVENPSSEIIEAVMGAVEWFEDVKIIDIATQNTGSDVVVVSSPGNVIWARFYDLDTNLPFFCGRDGIKKNTIAEIEIERRTGYAWYGNWPKNLLGSEYTSWKNKHGI